MQHHLASDWQDLSTTQLLNWPHVELTFRTKDICFVRLQATEFIRYLSFEAHDSNKSNQSIIEDVQETQPIYERKCYSYTFLDEYFKVYMEALISTTKVRSLVNSCFCGFFIVIFPGESFEVGGDSDNPLSIPGGREIHRREQQHRDQHGRVVQTVTFTVHQEQEIGEGHRHEGRRGESGLLRENNPKNKFRVGLLHAQTEGHCPTQLRTH
jgi:hypothetical protein